MNTASGKMVMETEERPIRMVITAGHGLLQQAVAYADGTMQLAVSRRWQCEPADACPTLEDAVYEEQSLFDDIDTTILLRPTATTIVPASLTGGGPDVAARVMNLYDLSETKECFMEQAGDADDNMLLYSLPAGMAGFLSRSFPTEKAHHALVPFLKAVMQARDFGSGDRMWADIHDGIVDVAAFRGQHLLLTNSWRWREPEDAAYYIAFAWRTLRLDDHAAQLSISGTARLRAAVIPMLRPYINYVTIATMPRSIKEANAAGMSLGMAFTLNRQQSPT